MQYAPLELLSKSDQPGREFDSRKEQFIKYGCKGLENMTAENYIDFMFSPWFMHPKYVGPYKDINALLWANSDDLLKTLGYTVNDVKTEKVSIVTEWRDIYLAPVLLEKWSKNKQVYKPHPVFAEMLMYTEKLQLCKEQLTHLPSDDIYIDLSDCPDFKPILGTFVHIHKRANGVDIAQYLLTDQMIYFSFYGGGDYDDRGIIEFSINDLPRKDYNICAPNANPDHVFKFTFDRRCVTVFIMQMLCYISSKKPDIEENPTTKSTYKPSAKVRNKFSEIRKWDVGVRYGKSINIMHNPSSVNRNEPKQNPDTNKKERKSPVPHYRNAHWQHYWTGKGRTTYEVRWIEPSFVGFSKKEDTPTDVVIHKIQ